MKLWHLAVFFLSLNSVTFASGYCNGYWCNGSIKQLYTHGSGNYVNLWMDVTKDELSHLQCKLDEGLYIRIDQSQPLFPYIYQSLLQATVTRTHVVARVNTDGGPCVLKYVMLEPAPN